jgi:hypothetical protein
MVNHRALVCSLEASHCAGGPRLIRIDPRRPIPNHPSYLSRPHLPRLGRRRPSPIGESAQREMSGPSVLVCGIQSAAILHRRLRRRSEKGESELVALGCKSHSCFRLTGVESRWDLLGVRIYRACKQTTTLAVTQLKPQAATKMMVSQRIRGKIVFVSSFLGYTSFAGYTPYAPGKYALRGKIYSARVYLVWITLTC